jgi:Pyruvate/2-oxoacid:ferredoxin oxidoreductase delta subunit
MRCAQCGWPVDEAAVLSTHHTSEGWVRYRRCVCGAVAIEMVRLGGGTGMQVEPVREPARAR